MHRKNLIAKPILKRVLKCDEKHRASRRWQQLEFTKNHL
jgi:hypothetical protein